MTRTDERDDPDAEPEIGSDAVEDATDGPKLEAINERVGNGDELPDAVMLPSSRFAVGDGDVDAIRLYLNEVSGSGLLTADGRGPFHPPCPQRR